MKFPICILGLYLNFNIKKETIMQKKSKLAAALEGGKPETPIVLKAADKKRSDRT